MKKIKIFATLFMFLIFSAPSFASSCDDYYVRIKNNTDRVWRIVDIHMYAGVLMWAPEVIMPGDLAEVISHQQGWRGPNPEIIMTDGRHTEMITAKQNWCGLSAGNIRVELSPAQLLRHERSVTGSWPNMPGFSYFNLHD